MLVLDTEIYRDYFLLSFLQIDTGKVRHFEMHADCPLDRKAIAAIMRQFTTISFNGNNFDLPLIYGALSGMDCAGLKKICDAIIKSKSPAWRIAREYEITIPSTWDHIDIMEVAPGQSGLKIYGGRLNAPSMQDLPIEPDASIAPSQREALRMYCENDLRTTALLYERLRPAIELRASMSEQYGMDLRSKSDAQIAETIIKSELGKITGKEYRAPDLGDNYGFRYRDPQIVSFATDDLREVYRRVCKERFTLGPNGSVVMPQWLRENKLQIGDAEYQMGIGGLHSCENSQHFRADGDHVIADWDVASYYPSIILQQRLAPESLGLPFLKVYRALVTKRLAAKKSGDKVTAETLKIAVNGSFGKLGSKYSALYAPDLLIQTTVTGQLALLMLIERLELAGVRVVSANTDGIVVYHRRDMQSTVDRITWGWMLDTSYRLEKTEYLAIASRDVNNYIAVKLDGKYKGKGVFASSGLSKNPDMPIIYRAVAEHVAGGKHYAQTIRDSRDVCEFVAVRRVQGGAQWRGELLGKAVRFYLSSKVPQDECIHYATNSNRVPKSAGARPLMTLPKEFPDDIDYEAYTVAAEKLLCEVGYRA